MQLDQGFSDGSERHQAVRLSETDSQSTLRPGTCKATSATEFSYGQAQAAHASGPRSGSPEEGAAASRAHQAGPEGNSILRLILSHQCRLHGLGHRTQLCTMIITTDPAGRTQHDTLTPYSPGWVLRTSHVKNLRLDADRSTYVMNPMNEFPIIKCLRT